MNATYMDLGLYNRLFPDRWNWRKPYRQLSFETQWKTQPTPSSVWKSYLGFDRTTLSLYTDGRTLSLEENNLYLNSVAKGSAKGHITWFAGHCSMAIAIVTARASSTSRQKPRRH